MHYLIDFNLMEKVCIGTFSFPRNYKNLSLESSWYINNSVRNMCTYYTIHVIIN